MKKNKTKTILIVFMILLLTSSALTAFAASGTQTIPVSYDNIKVYVNGTLTPMMTDGKAVEPFTYNGRTYVPLRAVSEALNQDVNWDGDTNSIRITASTDNTNFTPNEDQLEEYRLLYDINLVRRCAERVENQIEVCKSFFHLDASLRTSTRLQEIIEGQIRCEDDVDELPQSFLYQSQLAYDTLDKLEYAVMESRQAIAGYIQSNQTEYDAYSAWNIEFEASKKVSDILFEDINPALDYAIEQLFE